MLDDEQVRRQLRRGALEPLAALAQHLAQRAPRIGRLEAAPPPPQSRQRDAPQGAPVARAGHRVAALDERDLVALGESLGQLARAHVVPDSREVLGVDHHPARRAHAGSGSTSSRISRRSGL